MLSYAEALAAIDALVVIPRLETVPLANALGLVLAEDARLAAPQPPFDRATMDGYAVVSDGARTGFRVLGTVAAGSEWDGAALGPGEAVRIMTGAPAPAGTTVVPIEVTDRGETEVTVPDVKHLAAGRNIAWRGEDGAAGAVIVAAGTRLTPATIAAVAMCGQRQATVSWPPAVAVVTTGDEVGGEGAAAISDSNGPLLSALAQQLGLPHARIHVRDEAQALRLTLQAASEQADIVVTTGGVSAGARDLVPEVASHLGFAPIFHHVAIQPGKPIFLAQRTAAKRGTARFLIGLPGNPVSVLATAHLFLLPLIGRFLGGWKPAWLELPVAVDWTHSGTRHLFLPARLVRGGIEPIRWNGSGDLIAAAAGDGLVDLPPGTAATRGTLLRFLPFVGVPLGERGRIPPRPSR